MTAVELALEWCRVKRATVTWNEEGRCVIEVLAPGSSWRLLRTSAETFLQAVEGLRAEWEVTPPSQSGRHKTLGPRAS
jgi:hypothetical protein